MWFVALRIDTERDGLIERRSHNHSAERVGERTGREPAPLAEPHIGGRVDGLEAI